MFNLLIGGKNTLYYNSYLLLNDKVVSIFDEFLLFFIYLSLVVDY
jgi:hypothetical protein